MLEIKFGARLTTAVWNTHLFAFSAIFPLWLVSFYIFGLYDIKLAKNNISFFSAVLKATVLNGFISTTLFYLFPDFLGVTPKTNLFLTLLFFGLFVAVWRYLYNFLLKSPTLLREVIIVGKGGQVEELVEKINSNPQLGYKVISIIDPVDKKSLNNLPPSLHTLVCAVNISQHAELASSLFNSLAYFNFETFPSFYEKITGKIPLSEIDETWFLYNLKEREKVIYEKIKRLDDVLIGLIGGMITISIFPLIASIIKIDSPGNVFYKQIRIGKNGKEFNLTKFRSMKKDAEQNGAVWAQKNDPRITKIGKILRKSLLDEFPQFFNILRGDISLIGPRPERPEFIKELDQKIPFYQNRHLIKPGLTGWAQINFKYGNSETDALEKLQYDLFYIKNRSFLLDIQIILKTINLIFKGRM
jgi:exopolysaccharide biosynthesis polyprenyl glycosylphosphotransferase